MPGYAAQPPPFSVASHSAHPSIRLNPRSRSAAGTGWLDVARFHEGCRTADVSPSGVFRSGQMESGSHGQFQSSQYLPPDPLRSGDVLRVVRRRPHGVRHRHVQIVRAVDDLDGPTPARVSDGVSIVGEFHVKRPGGAGHAARLLSDADVVVVQHEYGIYGGDDGDDVLRVLEALTAPSIVVLHTVLEEPTSHQRRVLEQVASRASAVVVMSERARVAARHRLSREHGRRFRHPARGAGVGFARQRSPSRPQHDADLGTHRPRQGNRVGHPSHRRVA